MKQSTREDEARRKAGADQFVMETLEMDAFKAAHCSKKVGIPIEPDAPDCAGFWDEQESRP